MTRSALLCGLAATLMMQMTSVAAARKYEGFVPYETGQSVTIRPDRAYILVRAGTGPAFLRIPSENEQSNYRSQKTAALAKKGTKAPPYDQFVFEPKDLRNLYILWQKRPFEVGKPLPVQLIEAEPGDYILYGVSAPEAFLVCFCLGTVGFSAKAGTITDIGSIMLGQASEPSPFAELASETNIGATAKGDFPSTAGALRPYRAGDQFPATIAGLPRVEAKFRAIGPFVEPTARNINRLAAIPGILAYDRGKVIDVQSGQVIPSR